jgi:hypothetical protein
VTTLLREREIVASGRMEQENDLLNTISGFKIKTGEILSRTSE